MKSLAWVVCAVVWLGGVAAAQAPAPPDADGLKAKQLFERGMGHFQLEEYDKAIERWQDGFRIKPVPEFLYNIAQAYRLAKQPDKAISFYKKYLRMLPDAPNKAEVDRHVRELSRIVGEQERAANAPPTTPIRPGRRGERTPEPPPPEPTPVVTPAPTPAPTPVATPEPARADLTAKAPDNRPITKKPWFWGVIGAGAAVVVGAVIVGVVVGTSSGSSTKTLPELRF